MSDVAIQGLPASAGDATRLASRLGVPMHEIELHRFPDEEVRVRVGPAASTTIIYIPFDQPNDKLLMVVFAAEALRRDGAERLVLVAPYLCYMRQDAAFQKGEAISQRVIGGLLAGIVDRVITVDAHLHRTTGLQSVFPRIKADNRSAVPAIAGALRGAGLHLRTIVVCPDEESRPGAATLPTGSEWGRRLAPEAVVALDWHNDMSKLILDINDRIEGAADDRARGVIIRSLQRALETER